MVMKNAEHEIRELTHTHLFEHILIKIYGGVLPALEQGNVLPREQEARLAEP